MLLQGVLDTTRERERDAEAERGGSDDRVQWVLHAVTVHSGKRASECGR